MRQFIKDNLEEWLIGFILGLGFFPIIGLGAVVLGVVMGVLWRLGGSIEKAIRRYGVPLAIALSLGRMSWLIGGAFVLSVILASIGYGTLTLNQDGSVQDPGSPFGNLMLNLFGKNLGKWVARGVIIGSIWIVYGVAYGLATK